MEESGPKSLWTPSHPVVRVAQILRIADGTKELIRDPVVRSAGR